MTPDSTQPPEDHDETRPMFPHPRWTVGIVLIFGVLSVMAGFSDPIWFALGLPFILALVLYVFVWFKKRN